MAGSSPGCYHRHVQIEILEPEADALHLTPEEVRLDLAVGLYARRRVTLGRAA